jgi:hypothetical protein
MEPPKMLEAGAWARSELQLHRNDHILLHYPSNPEGADAIHFSYCRYQHSGPVGRHPMVTAKDMHRNGKKPAKVGQ